MVYSNIYLDSLIVVVVAAAKREWVPVFIQVFVSNLLDIFAKKISTLSQLTIDLEYELLLASHHHIPG